MNEREPSEGKIVIAYTGNLADRMQWDEAKLAELERRSNLASTIFIRSITQRVPNGTVPMGDTLALRSHKNPLENFAVSTPGSATRAMLDFYRGNAEITIDDQLVTERNMDKEKRVIRQDKFVSDINASVNIGLTEVIKKEKLYEAKTCMQIYLAFAPAILGISAGFYLTGMGTFDAFSGIFTKGFDGFLKEVKGLTEIFSAAAIIILAVHVSSFIHRTMPRGKLMARSLFNPLRHIKDLMSGLMYLRTEGKNIVSSDK